MSLVLAIEILGYIAICVGFLSYVVKKDTHLLSINAIFTTLLGTYFVLLGQLSGGYTLYFDTIKNLASLKYKYNYKILSIFIIINIVIIYFTFDGKLVSLLPALASISWTLGIFILQGISLRILVYFVTLTWLSYSLIIQSNPGILGGIINLIAISIGTYRLYLSKKTS